MDANEAFTVWTNKDVETYDLSVRSFCGWYYNIYNGFACIFTQDGCNELLDNIVSILNRIT